MKQAKAREIPLPKMNKTEAAFANTRLKVLQATGVIVWWGFEQIKFRLADNSYYTPDFVSVWNDGHIEVTEIKGFLREAALVRFKQAAEMYGWMKWEMVKKATDHGGWETMYAY